MLTPITVTGLLANPDGSQPTGAMTFVLTDPGTGLPVTMQDSGTGEIVVPQPVVASIQSGRLLANPVGAGPYGPLVLIANDDATTEPTDTVYMVTEQLTAGGIPPWPLTVHHLAPGGTLDISSQRPVPS